MWLPTEAASDFPNIRIASADHVIKRIEVEIEGCSGEFYGLVRKSNSLPDGFGVFVACNGWVHCGRVENCLFNEGRMISVNRGTQELKLINQKL